MQYQASICHDRQTSPVNKPALFHGILRLHASTCECRLHVSTYMPQLVSVDYIPQWSRGVVAITTAQLHSTKPELRFCAGSNPARGVSETRHGEDLPQ